MDEVVSLMLGGDVMLGRLVKKHIRAYGADYPLGQVAGLMRGADLTLVNLECAITAHERIWEGSPKAFYFGAPPQAVASLAHAGVDMVSLANNHMLDFGVAGLQDTLRHLDARNIRRAGAGKNLAEALAPAFMTSKGMRFGMVAFCDHQADFAAGEHRAGIAYLDLDAEKQALAAFRQGLDAIRRDGAERAILSLHWGPNMVHRPSPYFVRLAHAAMDMGYDLLFGHSAHVFHGIELYRGKPIVYAAGDLVDDYYADPAFGNDHQLLFELAWRRDGLARIRLHPVFIEDCRTMPASGAQFEFIARRVTTLCAELGTMVQRSGAMLEITPAGEVVKKS